MKSRRSKSPRQKTWEIRALAYIEMHPGCHIDEIAAACGTSHGEMRLTLRYLEDDMQIWRREGEIRNGKTAYGYFSNYMAATKRFTLHRGKHGNSSD